MLKTMFLAMGLMVLVICLIGGSLGFLGGLIGGLVGLITGLAGAAIGLITGLLGALIGVAVGLFGLLLPLLFFLVIVAGIVQLIKLI